MRPDTPPNPHFGLREAYLWELDLRDPKEP
jgi:hypothetical protein